MMDYSNEGWNESKISQGKSRGGVRNSFTLFGGSANPQLAETVGRELGVALGASEVELFPDGEISVHLLEPVRRRDVFILQPTSPPVDEHLVELLCFAGAARRSAANRITAVLPYFGYSRSDKRHARREPIVARMVSDLLQAVNVEHVLTLISTPHKLKAFFGFQWII
jgi:ribose-phosphate pyrophosphokinase